MESVLLVIHVIVALLIVGLIMLQQGKGAEMGASFGAGSSQTVFGSVGSGNFFSRMTALLVAVFFVTSFVLAVFAQKSVSVDDVQIPELERVIEQPAVDSTNDGAIPTLNEDEAANDVIPELDASEDTGEIPSVDPDSDESELSR